MISDLETFNYFVDDVLYSDANLLKYELDILLMQNLFNSNDLEAVSYTHLTLPTNREV